MRVLVLDQEKFWREMARDCLQPEGYRVELVSDDICFHKAVAKCPDIVLLGFPIIGPREEEIVRCTTRTCPSAIVLVFSTSWPVSQSAERRLLRMGVSDVMGRPGDGCDLVRLVERERAAQRKELASLSSYRQFRLQEAR